MGYSSGPLIGNQFGVNRYNTVVCSAEEARRKLIKLT
jgi:hypothetical protein